MCLVSKLENGKVVYIANHRITEPCQHPVLYYNIDVYAIEYVSNIELSTDEDADLQL